MHQLLRKDFHEISVPLKLSQRMSLISSASGCLREVCSLMGFKAEHRARLI
jgi:hypothetical protein